MKKRILSVLLAFAMIFTLMPTALAAPTTYQVVTVDKTTVQAGETVNVKVTLPEGIQTAGSFTANLKFDMTLFEVVSRVAPPKISATDEGYGSQDDVKIFANTAAIANTSGELTANAAYTYNTMEVAGVTVIDATLKAKASGVAAFSFSIFEITYSDNGTQYIVKKDQLEAPPSVTIPKAPITSVSAKVDAPQKGVALDTTVDVGGATAYTGTVKWYVGETEATETIAKANTEYTAKITLTAKTADGESFDSSLGGKTTAEGYKIKFVDAGKLELTKTFDATGNKTLNGIDIITNPALTLAVPTAAPNATATNERSLAVTGVYDDGSGGPVEGATWKITTDPIPKGVSLDGCTLKVTNEAEASNVRVEVTAAGFTDAETVTITKDDPAASAIVLTPPASTTVAVPKNDTPNKIDLPAAAVYDQYGKPMTGTVSITYEFDGTTPTGVTLAPGYGKIEVDRTAQAGEVNIVAKLGTTLTSNPVTYTITRETSQVTSVRVNAPEYIMNVPKVTEPGTPNQAHQQFDPAKVLDQYGQEMTGQTVTWNVTDDAGKSVTGVSIDNNGKLTVTNEAPAITVYVTATCSGIVSNKSKVTINKEPAKDTFVEICNQVGDAPETSLAIPTGTVTKNVDYTAKVYDQYGKLTAGMVDWKLDKTYTGVELDTTSIAGSATLKVDSTATPGTIKLIANCSTSGSTASKTLEITLANKTPATVTTAPKAVENLKYTGGEQALLTAGVASGGTMQYSLGSSPWSTAIPTAKDAATYTVQYRVKGDETHADSTPVTLTVTIGSKVLTKDDLTPTGSTSKVYDGTTNSSIPVGVKAGVLYGADTLSITGSAVYNSADVNEANTITFTPNAITTGNYQLAASEVLTITGAKITPKDLTVTPNAGQSKKFGAVDPTLHSTNSGRVSGQIPDFTGALSRAEGEDVGQYDITQGTLALMDHFSSGFKASNYTLKMVSPAVKFEITKADAPTLKDITDSQKYTVTTEQNKDIGTAGMPANAGTLIYAKGTEGKTGSVTVTSWDVDSTGKVTYTLSGGVTGDTVTLPVIIKSTNYADATVKVVITLTAKDDQAALTLTGGTTVVYGQTLQLGTSGGSGTGAVTYAVTNGTGEATIDAASGKLTPVKVGTVKVKATKAADASFNEATSAEVEITINRATPTGEPAYTKITTSGKTLADAGLTTAGSTLNPNAGTLEWVDDTGTVLPGTTTVAANTTYKWRFTPTDTNYETLTGSIELYHKSSSSGGGGSSSSSRYAITVDKTENGTITVSPKSASKGDTVTITVKPDKGYELDTLKVLDKDGDKVKITEKKGKYTFTMPASKVTVKGKFVEEAPEQIFADVPVDAYCYEAVKWAASEGITGGIGNNLFAPGLPCTRGQIVTFLWRAAGSPAPKSMSSFADVAEDAYYAKAVAWAVENGITGGTGNGKFSPDATCTRAQAVTFLYRASGSPAVSGSAAFSDVASDAYYAAAVAWAEKNDITGGIGNGLFGSGKTCTRAQIVTFLYRAMK